MRLFSHETQFHTKKGVARRAGPAPGGFWQYWYRYRKLVNMRLELPMREEDRDCYIVPIRPAAGPRPARRARARAPVFLSPVGRNNHRLSHTWVLPRILTRRVILQWSRPVSFDPASRRITTCHFCTASVCAQSSTWRRSQGLRTRAS